jgi:hypothetical protein
MKLDDDGYRTFADVTPCQLQKLSFLWNVSNPGVHGKNDNFKPVFEPVLGAWIMNVRNEHFLFMFGPGHLSTLEWTQAGKSRYSCSSICNGVVVIVVWWSVFPRLRHPETNTIAPKLNYVPFGICITCRVLGYECYRLLQIYNCAFFAVFSNFFIYSQLP